MKKIITIAVLGAVLTLAGCTSMKSIDAKVKTKSSRKVRITNVNIHEDSDGLHIIATLHPKSTTVRHTGHIDISFIGKSGEVLESIKAEPHPHIFSRYSRQKPTISERIDLNSSDVMEISLTHHIDTSNACNM